MKGLHASFVLHTLQLIPSQPSLHSHSLPCRGSLLLPSANEPQSGALQSSPPKPGGQEHLPLLLVHRRVSYRKGRRDSAGGVDHRWWYRTDASVGRLTLLRAGREAGRMTLYIHLATWSESSLSLGWLIGSGCLPTVVRV
ncbi:hypothetical protein KC325_g255 [Hortaea werneckii]|nr:hypothetical protein KC325_g255 [Hortaea werneckii]